MVINTNTGKVFTEGETHKRPMLAKTLLYLAQNGPDAFYKGRLGRLVLAELQKMGSNITLGDLNEYRY